MLAQDCHEQLVIGGEFRNGKLAVSMKRGSAELVLLLHASHEETDPRNMRNMRQKKLPQLSSSRLIPAYSSFAFQTGRTLAGCKEWWFWPGVRDEIRLIQFTKLLPIPEEKLWGKIPACHSLTGCDPTSSLAGIGKRSAWKVFRNGKRP